MVMVYQVSIVRASPPAFADGSVRLCGQPSPVYGRQVATFDEIHVVLPNNGWVHVLFADPDAPDVLVRPEESEGRLVITGLVVRADPVDSSVTKSIPIARIESYLNIPDLRQFIAEGVAAAPDPLTPVLTQMFGPPEDERARQPRPARKPREPLTRPDGSDPEGFYRRVAEAYSELLAQTSAPAPLMAAEANVPVPTVHRWVFEARRRGVLPPARKGRAG